MIKHYKAVLLSVIHRVWHFMSIQFPPRRTQVYFRTLSWFKCFLIEKLWGKQWLVIGQAVVILTENVELWMWKMSACLEMQSFFLTPWSTRRQTRNTPGTFWWDFFKLFGVLWHCCNPNYVPQGREEIPRIIQMPCTLVLAQAISATLPSHQLGSGTAAPVPAGTASGHSDVPVQTQQLSQVWTGQLQPFPGITLPIQLPSFQTNHRTTFLNARAGFKSWWGGWDGASPWGIPETNISFQLLSLKELTSVLTVTWEQ